MHKFYLLRLIDLQLMKLMGWEKNPKRKSKKEQKKKPFGYPPFHPLVYMEIDCFPVSERTENKPDLP